MCRTGIAVVVFFLLFFIRDLSAQQATPLALKVSISEDLRRRYGLNPQERRVFETSVSEKIVSKIADRYWYRFCWQLFATDEDSPAPDGEIRIELDRNRRRDNWNMNVSVSRDNSPRVRHSFEPVEVLESGELLRTHGPTKEELPDELAEWLRVHYFSDDKVLRLHDRLRLIPVGEGVPSTNRAAVAPKTHGAVLIPWRNFSQFRWSKFRFECPGQDGFEHWQATATGGSILLGENEVIDVVHDEALPGQVPPRGAVFLVEFVEKDRAEQPTGESELLMIR